MKTIDLRSDTVTKPSPEMRRIMAGAEVGDDVYGEDPTVNRLEILAASMLGMENAIFVPSGTQANLLGLLSHCERGDEYIVGQTAHTYRFEGGGAAVLGSIQPQPLDFEVDGTLDLKKVAAAIKPDDAHFARTKLLCLENTHQGKAIPQDYIEKASLFAKDRGLKIHLDGARLFNAAIKHKVEVKAIAQYFDSASFCLSKGLGAPVGSMLCASEEIIQKARRWRKTLGGGMRQAGIIAAAGIYALENNIDRLETDHQNASLLASGLKNIENIRVEYVPSQTNMVFVTVPEKDMDPLKIYMKKNGILMDGRDKFRLVTHLDVCKDDIQKTIDLINTYYQIAI